MNPYPPIAEWAGRPVPVGKSKDMRNRSISNDRGAIDAAPNANIPWQERRFQTMRSAAQIAGISVASLYGAAARGEISLRKLAGRTLIETSSLVSFLDTAANWQPSDRNKQAIAARGPRAAQARA